MMRKSHHNQALRELFMKGEVDPCEQEVYVHQPARKEIKQIITKEGSFSSQHLNTVKGSYNQIIRTAALEEGADFGTAQRYEKNDSMKKL